MDRLKEKVLNINWWDVIYLIIFGLIVSYEFYHTTLLNLKWSWPPKTGLVLMGMSALYTIAKLFFYKVYSQKEKIFSLFIIISFVMPAILTEYRFLFWIGFLIVGAKDVDFKKILKVYLLIAISIMVMAFAASQYGIIEDLQFIAYRGNEMFTRHSYGIQYPTDYAAHLFYIVLAIAVLFHDKLNVMAKVWLSLMVALSVYMTANALTTMLCLVGFAGLCVFERVFRKYMQHIEKVFRWMPVICATIYLSLSYFYNENVEWLFNLNKLLTKRLAYGKFGLLVYDIKLFGQNVYEQGFGNALENSGPYYFLDDSYIKILLEYGLVALVITLAVLVLISKKAGSDKKFTLVIALVAIAVHSFMEHHLINVAYNPMILALFANLEDKEQINRRNL